VKFHLICIVSALVPICAVAADDDLQRQIKSAGIILNYEKGIAVSATIGLKKVSPTGVALLKDLSTVKGVGFYELAGIDKVIGSLSDNPNLETLSISDCPLTDNGFCSLKNCKKLELLYINRAKISPKAISHIAANSSLTVLELSGITVTAAFADELGKMPKLKLLGLDNCTIIDDQAVMKNISKVASITFLSLKNTTCDDECMTIAAQMKNLRAIILDGTLVSEDGVRKLRGAKQLELLSIEGTDLSESTLKSLREANPKLTIKHGVKK